MTTEDPAPRLALHLHDGTLLETRDGRPHRVGADGVGRPLPHPTPRAWWTSLSTLARYPVGWDLQDRGQSLEVRARGCARELQFDGELGWHGPVDVFDGERCVGAGLGWSRAASPTVAEMLVRAGEETRRAVAALLPLAAEPSGLARVLATPDRPGWIAGADLDGCAQALIAPLRYTVDLGGKAWRSLILVAATDLVGGDPEVARAWMAVPEVVHSGSLMVDDVQDGSPLRRGGPSCHLVHGVPLAVNAGTFGYLVADVLIRESGLPAERRAWLYEELLGALRAAHAGQALDLRGLDIGLDADLLRQRLHAVHRLKSGVPTAAGARLGAILGGGTPTQVEIVGRYAEALGLAYQVRDDVLDVRGHGDRKARGEDLAAGKVTFPLVEALGRVDATSADRLRAAVRDPDAHRAALPELVERIARSGALEACEAHADELVRTAWGALDDAFPDGRAKATYRMVSQALLGRAIDRAPTIPVTSAGSRPPSTIVAVP